MKILMMTLMFHGVMRERSVVTVIFCFVKILINPNDRFSRLQHDRCYDYYYVISK